MTTEIMEPVTIRLEESRYGRFRCFFCRGESDKAAVQPFVYSGKDRNGVICEKCLVATPTEFVTLLREEAEYFTMVANTFAELGRNPPLRPTIETLDAARDAREKEMAAERRADGDDDVLGLDDADFVF